MSRNTTRKTEVEEESAQTYVNKLCCHNIVSTTCYIHLLTPAVNVVTSSFLVLTHFTSYQTSKIC